LEGEDFRIRGGTTGCNRTPDIGKGGQRGDAAKDGEEIEAAWTATYEIGGEGTRIGKQHFTNRFGSEK
jgi:hypothetical protein